MKIYLASASPRRRQLLEQIGIEFELLIPNVDETPLADEKADDYVARVAELKATTAYAMAKGDMATEKPAKDMPILAADTSVINDGVILGKPADKADCMRMLKSLSGKTHQVKTAISVVYQGIAITHVISTDVLFRELSDDEIEQYWLTGEPQDKAGAYGIQGIAGKFVKSINGSYSSVVGLPLLETEQLLKEVLA